VEVNRDSVVKADTQGQIANCHDRTDLELLPKISRRYFKGIIPIKEHCLLIVLPITKLARALGPERIVEVTRTPGNVLIASIVQIMPARPWCDEDSRGYWLSGVRSPEKINWLTVPFAQRVIARARPIERQRLPIWLSRRSDDRDSGGRLFEGISHA